MPSWLRSLSRRAKTVFAKPFASWLENPFAHTLEWTPAQFLVNQSRLMSANSDVHPMLKAVGPDLPIFLKAGQISINLYRSPRFIAFLAEVFSYQTSNRPCAGNVCDYTHLV